MRMTVAAVIPLYNGAEFIEEAIQSVLRQTEPADEIIIVDDGSTDEGPEIVRALVKLNPITLLSKPNGGQSSARNMAVRHTNCSHIAFLDQDDAWYEDHLEILKKQFHRSSAQRLALVYGNLDIVDRRGRMISYCILNDIPSPQPKTSLRQCLEQDLFILPSATVVSRDAIVDVGFFDERLSGYEDDDLFTRMFSAGYRSIYINQAVTRWRLYGGSSSFSERMANSRMIYFRKQIELFPNDPAVNQWAHNAIARRFMKIVFTEFLAASRSHDVPRLERAWSDSKEIAPAMGRRTQRRVQLLSPLIERLYDGPLTGVARSLARYAIKL